MIYVNIGAAKTNLSRYLEAAENGETVIICRNNVPVAELKALQAGEIPIPTDKTEREMPLLD